MNVLILSKTRMYNERCCVGGITDSGKAIRLLTETFDYQPGNTDFEPRQVWDIDFSEKPDCIKPHIEDVVLKSKKFLYKINDEKKIKDIIQYYKIRIWCGSSDSLFDGKLKWTNNGSGYISHNMLPNQSVGFWISDEDLFFTEDNGIRYKYKERFLKFVGTDYPVEKIPKGTLIRVSLARWWRKEEDMEERCYLQLSGWYDYKEENLKTIYDPFKNFKLTNGQMELLNRIDTFLTDNTSCFILQGYAGTGKTFMLGGLTKYFKSINVPFVLAAPTGRAAKIVSLKTKCKAYTIHKTIYSSNDLREFKIQEKDGSETYRFYYDLKNNENPTNTVYIIDEGSMISNSYSEQEFFRFGSGHLLQDLFKYINFDNNDHKKKIIIVGDSAQLPPVGMDHSPALDEKYLTEQLGISVQKHELTEVVRQQENSGILYNATEIRTSISNNIFNHLNIETNLGDIESVKHQDLLQTYINACNDKISDEVILISHSNSSVKEYNDFIRGHFFPGCSSIAANDRIIIVKNNYSHPIELLNGDYGIVQELLTESEIRNIVIRQKSNSGLISEKSIFINFKDVIIQFSNNDNQLVNLKCKIIQNLLDSKERELSSDESKALYIDFKMRHPNLRPGTKDFKDALLTDQYFNALQIKFGYAITCHKAQGGEWKNAIVDCKFSTEKMSSSYFRWLYTAITRAKQKLYLMNEPHFDLVSKISDNFNPFIVTANVCEVESLPDVLPEEIQHESMFLKGIYCIINDFIKNTGIRIDKIVHHQYCEHYLFISNENLVLFKLYYNHHQIISKITKPTIDDEHIETIGSFLESLIDKKIILNTKDDVVSSRQIKTFEFTEQFLSDFHNLIVSKITEENIYVTNIKQNQWNQKYFFEQNNLNTVIDFYYNKKKQFTSCNFVNSKSISTELANKVIELIGISNG